LQGSGRSSVTVSIPLSDAGWVDSPVPCPPSPSRSSQIHTPASHPPPTPITNHRAKTIDETYNQMTLNHRESLAYISDHLADYVRSRDVPLSNEKLNQLKFSEIIFKSYTPTLIKGASLFFEAAIRRDEQITYDITLMVRRFLQHSSHFSARTCKAFVMPRLKLISFHSLAANNFDKLIDIETYERHVCFIMVQLVCALKSLQSDGVEQLSNNFREFLLAYRYVSNSSCGLLCCFKETVSDDLEESNRGSVSICKYALRALCTLLHHKMDNGVPTIPNHSQYSSTLLKCAEVLNEEKSSSLSNAKNILEYSFWLGANTEFENEFDAKIWLDSQRSRDVDRLVSAFESLNETVERLRVQFLLSITPRSLFTSSEMLRKSYY
uniref:Ras-GAP domain-containing protein n=1 Tax=Toxocara canis TaxID=6265 RepID=A0A183UGW7_TOXCA